MNPRSSRLAITSFALGLLSLLFLPPLLALAALIVGIIALRKIKAAPENLKGKGMAIAGVVLGGMVWLLIFAGIALAMAVRTHYLPFRIPTASMEPAVKSGERAIIDRKAYTTNAPSRGDVIVYLSPEGNKKLYIKRITGLPGEALEIKEGKVFINGSLTQIPGLAKTVRYINQGAFAKPGQAVKIPAGSFYVLGDNSKQSLDSRFHGYVKKENIQGKLVMVLKDSRGEVTMELLRLFFTSK